MASPFKQHQDSTRARLMSSGVTSGPAAPPTDGPFASAYALKLAALGIDLKRLREIQSVEKKIEAKREMIMPYLDHIDGWLQAVDQAATPVQDEVVVTMMIWLMDIGEFERALQFAEPIVKHGLTLPERYDRTTATLVAEEIAEAALKALGTAGDGVFNRLILERAEHITEGADMPDQVRAKLFKALAMAELADAERMAPDDDGPAGNQRATRESALGHFKRALVLNSAVGVKKPIEQLERVLAG